MVCKVCNQEVEVGLKICPYCGASMEENEASVIDLQFTNKKATSITDKKPAPKKTKKGISKKNLIDEAPIKIVDDFEEEPVKKADPNEPITLDFFEPEDNDPTPITVVEDEEATETIRPLFAKEKKQPKKLKSLEREPQPKKPAPVEDKAEKPQEEPQDVPQDDILVVAEAPVEEPIEEEPVEEPVEEEPTEEPIEEEPVEEPIEEEPAEEPVEEEPAEEPIEEEPVEEPIEEEPTEEPIEEEPVEEPVEEAPAEEPIEEEPTEEPIEEEPVEEPVEEAPVEDVAETIPEFLPEEVIEEYIPVEEKKPIKVIREETPREIIPEEIIEEPIVEKAPVVKKKKEEPKIFLPEEIIEEFIAPEAPKKEEPEEIYGAIIEEVEEPTEEEPTEEPILEEEPIIEEEPYVPPVIDENWQPDPEFLPEEVLEDYIEPMAIEPEVEEYPEPVFEEENEFERTEVYTAPVFYDPEADAPFYEEEPIEITPLNEETPVIEEPVEETVAETPVEEAVASVELCERVSKRKIEREQKPVKDRVNFFLLLFSLMFPPYLGTFIWITRSSRKPKASTVYGVLGIISYVVTNFLKKLIVNVLSVLITIVALVGFIVFAYFYIQGALLDAGYIFSIFGI